MNESVGIGLIWGLGALALVGSALVARRLPLGQAVRMALAWIAIFAIAIVLVSQRHHFGRVWNDVSGDLFGRSQTVVGGTVRVPQSPDGHFWVDAIVNGQPVRMLVDSGATTTSLSSSAARAGDVAISSSMVVPIGTANGTVLANRATIGTLRIGEIVAEDLPAVTADAFGDTSVLGMNFLSDLESWRVEGRTLVMTPRT